MYEVLQNVIYTLQTVPSCENSDSHNGVDKDSCLLQYDTTLKNTEL
jgi:hypothetical protein